MRDAVTRECGRGWRGLEKAFLLRLRPFLCMLCSHVSVIGCSSDPRSKNLPEASALFALTYTADAHILSKVRVHALNAKATKTGLLGLPLESVCGFPFAAQFLVTVKETKEGARFVERESHTATPLTWFY